MPTLTKPAPAALKIASPVVAALRELSDETRNVAMELFEQLASGELDAAEEASTLALLADMFPTDTGKFAAEWDAAEAEERAVEEKPEAKNIRAHVDRQEATFAERLQAAMTARGVTQSELAVKIGVGQPAISMMLNRACRPQRNTVQKLATALGVTPADLWPG